MIEYWQKNVSHVQYYQQCQVSSCTYLITSRFNLIYIITTLVAFIGGLAKVLRIIIPRAVKFIRHQLTPPPTITNIVTGKYRFQMKESRIFRFLFQSSSSVVIETSLEV